MSSHVVFIGLSTLRSPFSLIWRKISILDELGGEGMASTVVVVVVQIGKASFLVDPKAALGITLCEVSYVLCISLPLEPQQRRTGLHVGASQKRS